MDDAGGGENKYLTCTVHVHVHVSPHHTSNKQNETRESISVHNVRSMVRSGASSISEREREMNECSERERASKERGYKCVCVCVFVCVCVYLCA